MGTTGIDSFVGQLITQFVFALLETMLSVFAAALPGILTQIFDSLLGFFPTTP